MELYNSIIENFLNKKPYERDFDLSMFSSNINRSFIKYIHLLRNGIFFTFNPVENELGIDFLIFYNNYFYLASVNNIGFDNDCTIISKIRKFPIDGKQSEQFFLKKKSSFNEISTLLKKFGLLSKEFLTYFFIK